MVWERNVVEVIGCKKEKATVTKKATMNNFYHQYYNPFNFMQPISPSMYNSNPAAASTPILTSNEKIQDKRNKKVLQAKEINGWVLRHTN